MENYDALEEERRWRQRQPKAGKRLRVMPERHNFAHAHVRLKMYQALVGLGCDKESFILEVGCGSGEYLEYISKASGVISGIDISPDALKSYLERGYNGILADALTMPFPDNAFDYVMYPAILHHLIGQGDLVDYLKESVRVAKPGGYVMALEPNMFNISGMLMNIFNTIKPGITGLVPHERALSPLYLVQVFKDAGLKDVKCVAASYVWNRLPLWLSQFISRHEDTVTNKKPFSYLGWFEIITGQKSHYLSEQDDSQR